MSWINVIHKYVHTTARICLCKFSSGLPNHHENHSECSSWSSGGGGGPGKGNVGLGDGEVGLVEKGGGTGWNRRGAKGLGGRGL